MTDRIRQVATCRSWNKISDARFGSQHTLQPHAFHRKAFTLRQRSSQVVHFRSERQQQLENVGSSFVLAWFEGMRSGVAAVQGTLSAVVSPGVQLKGDGVFRVGSVKGLPALLAVLGAEAEEYWRVDWHHVLGAVDEGQHVVYRVVAYCFQDSGALPGHPATYRVSRGHAVFRLRLSEDSLRVEEVSVTRTPTQEERDSVLRDPVHCYPAPLPVDRIGPGGLGRSALESTARQFVRALTQHADHTELDNLLSPRCRWLDAYGCWPPGPLNPARAAAAAQDMLAAPAGPSLAHKEEHLVEGLGPVLAVFGIDLKHLGSALQRPHLSAQDIWGSAEGSMSGAVNWLREALKWSTSSAAEPLAQVMRSARSAHLSGAPLWEAVRRGLPPNALPRLPVLTPPSDVLPKEGQGKPGKEMKPEGEGGSGPSGNGLPSGGQSGAQPPSTSSFSLTTEAQGATGLGTKPPTFEDLSVSNLDLEVGNTLDMPGISSLSWDSEQLPTSSLDMVATAQESEQLPTSSLDVAATSGEFLSSEKVGKEHVQHLDPGSSGTAVAAGKERVNTSTQSQQAAVAEAEKTKRAKGTGTARERHKHTTSRLATERQSQRASRFMSKEDIIVHLGALHTAYEVHGSQVLDVALDPDVHNVVLLHLNLALSNRAGGAPFLLSQLALLALDERARIDDIWLFRTPLDCETHVFGTPSDEGPIGR